MRSLDELDAERIRLEQAMRRARYNGNTAMYGRCQGEHARVKRRIQVLEKRRRVLIPNDSRGRRRVVSVYEAVEEAREVLKDRRKR